MNQIINQPIIDQVQLDYKNIPLAVFLVGTNGCGKSSLRNYLNLSDIQTNIDPDLLNRIYQGKFPHSYQIEAGKQALRMYEHAVQQGFNLCLESTLAGKGTMQRINAAKRAGYYTIAYYIGLNSVELNLERIAMRVARGGHDIPEPTVRKRFHESENNLLQVKENFDIIHVIDNSEAYFRLQYSIIDKNLVKHSRTLETWAANLLARVYNTVTQSDF
jgi:predicted ABC-type ATPase